MAQSSVLPVYWRDRYGDTMPLSSKRFQRNRYTLIS